MIYFCPLTLNLQYFIYLLINLKKVEPFFGTIILRFLIYFIKYQTLFFFSLIYLVHYKNHLFLYIFLSVIMLYSPLMLINQSTLINLFLFVYYSIDQSENLVSAISFTIQDVQSKF